MVGNRWGSIVLTPLWVTFVTVLSVWARARTSLAGMTRIHLAVIGSWAALWGVTVIVGSLRFQGRLAWWVAGGLAMAVPPLLGAWVTYRRTER